MKNKLVKYYLPILGIIVLLLDISYSILPSPLNKLRKIYPSIDLSVDIYDNDGKEISDFAIKKTESDAIFIVPPDFGSFRLSANRAIVVDLKCIDASDKGIQNWWTRINDCYGELSSENSPEFNRKQIYENYKAINDDRLKYVSKKYNAQYAILYNETISSFGTLFSGKKYKIINLF